MPQSTFRCRFGAPLILTFVALVLMVFSGAMAENPVSAAQTVAMMVVGRFNDALLSTMKDGTTLKFTGRVDRLTPVISQTFDLATMTKIAVGSRWANLPPDEQQRLIVAFSRFSIANYASNFDSYAGERFEIFRESPLTGGDVMVETRLTPKTGDAVDLSYRLRPGTDGPRIIDVFVNGTISELAARRSEFTSVLNNGGPEALEKLLETRTQTLATH